MDDRDIKKEAKDADDERLNSANSRIMTNSVKYEETELGLITESSALKSSKKLETLDDALPYVGDFGRYHIWLLMALLPYSFAFAALYFSQFFFTIVPQEHWCKIDELSDFSPEIRRKAIPESDNYPYYDTCYRKDLNFTALLSSPDLLSASWDTNKTVKCESWEYNFTSIPYASMGAELDWVCEHSYLVSTAQAIFYCGSILGGLVFGWIADNRGRIPALTLCAACAIFGSLATATTHKFWTFTVFRFFSGMAYDNIINIPLIIVLEYMAVRKHSLVVNVAFGVFFSVASTMLPWVAYYLADWRKLCYYSALPYLCCLLSPWILPESARFYISNQMYDKVIEKLKKIATVNNVKPDPHFYETFRENLSSIDNQRETASILDLFKTPRLAKTTIILLLFWSLVTVAFDSHVYSLKLLQGSVFVSFSLACATELPAGLLLTFLLDRWGRRFCAFITMFSTTIFSLIEGIIDAEGGKLAMSISSRFALNMAANIVLQYAAELLPTPVRVQGIAMIHIFGYIAHSIAPYVVDTAQLWSRLPMFIIGVVSFTSATIVIFLPETLDCEMPQTLQEGEDFGKEQKFWSLPCLGNKKKHKFENGNCDKKRNGSSEH